MINIETYQSVAKSDTCNRCGSKTVTWWRDNAGKPHLAEIFTLTDEEVFCETDHHLRYCPVPIMRWSKTERISDPLQRKVRQQKDLNDAVDAFFDDDDEDGNKEPEEIKHDGHPYCCANCGTGIVDGIDSPLLRYEYQDGQIGKLHTCPPTYRDKVSANRARGTNLALKIKFAEISHRMEIVQEEMLERHRVLVAEGGHIVSDPEGAALAAEYLMLDKRLYTEIPA